MALPGKGWRSSVGWILGVGLLLGLAILLQLSVGWGALLTPWRDFSARELMGALGLVVASYGIRAVRVHEYFRPDTSGRFHRSFRLILLHNFFNNLLPMRSGEASFPILMQREFQVPFSRSLPGLLYLRLLDLHFLLCLGAVVLLSGRTPEGWILPALMVPFLIALFTAQEWLGHRLEHREGKLGRVLNMGLAGLPSTPALFWGTWGWTAVNWGMKLLVFAWVLRAFTPMPISAALMGSATGEISSVLPFHGLAGAGTYEAGVMAGLVPFGIDLESALTGAVNLHLFVLGVSVLSGLLALVLPAGQHPSGPKERMNAGGAAPDSRENPVDS
jgi:uncharacterized membrane protein YbhN (UPF0104 family)